MVETREANKDMEKECWGFVFKNPKQYVDVKLTMLRKDMYINPTKAEVDHLYELKDQYAIDRAVASIIDRHWSTY